MLKGIIEKLIKFIQIPLKDLGLILKRGINGIYIWTSKKHINKYLLEFSYRYNKRHLDDFGKFGSFFQNCEGKNLSYKELIA